MIYKLNSQGFKNLLFDQIAATCLVMGFVFYTIWDQLFWWGTREDYSFGYIVPFFFAYVIYNRWPIIRGYLFPRKQEEESAYTVYERGLLVIILEWIALAGFTASLLLFVIGSLLRAVSGPQNTASLAIAASLGGIIISAVFIFTECRADGQPIALKQRLALTALFIFPALIWMISAPLVSILETNIRVFLLSKVTIVVFNIFDFLGYELEREGNVLILPQGQVGVEEACSGIRSLTACLFAGSFLAAVYLNRYWKKICLVAVAMILAVTTNLMRSIFLTFWAYTYGSEAIDEHWVIPLFGDIGSVHDVTGMAILGLTCLGLICILPIFNFNLHDHVNQDWNIDKDTEA